MAPLPQQVTLLSQHQKRGCIAPALEPLGIELHEYAQFDTDQLGTFAGDVERTLSPIECAAHKARLACELTHSDWGLGSEGSFATGLAGVTWNTELLVLYDRQHDCQLVAKAEGPMALAMLRAENAQELQQQLQQYPQQGWILRRPDVIHKGLYHAGELTRLLTDDDWPLVLEPDFRALHSPLRRQRIAQAAANLAEQLKTACPDCDYPGFSVASHTTGLPCAVCSAPTRQVRVQHWRCNRCQHERQQVVSSLADPYFCALCNP
ncbi:hypothetical protein CHH28_04275 [Bacterioplanes sanyensis]|uniref:DUF6671 domain-containing protein n=1 Tax=Bacterioplanes sanyensis TaxID=1249553 RepID=A0A222FHQ3_9GAMM|nr:DUF6671 family protein [Bacterioplanes sanyensis]ASP37941.1 hypothetical protein CHH28_04275 [Bacterioplanes sanyensis]